MFEPYSYLKKDRGPEEHESEIVIRISLPHFPKLNPRPILSSLLIFLGLYFIGSQIVLPVLKTPAEKPLLRPLVEAEASAASGNLVQATGLEPFKFSELAGSGTSFANERASGTAIFYLTIPKLKIERAEVETNSSSLSPDERLGHYSGSSLPGHPGNAFIYGHSALPLFYNPRDYRTIFTHIGDLEDGDEILVEFGEARYKYRVFKKVVLNPEDVKPLEPISPQFLNQAYLTLMTCVPPGLDTKRLMVYAQLVL
jgi:LPXTG-site transpeptidase (sortase) family protein